MTLNSFNKALAKLLLSTVLVGVFLVIIGAVTLFGICAWQAYHPPAPQAIDFAKYGFTDPKEP